MLITLTEEIDISELSLDELKSMPVAKLANIVYQLAHKPEPAKKEKDPVSYNYGYKREGSSSKFHYVSWIKQEEAWIVQIMGNRIGEFDDEIIAALAADKHLDSIGDLDRPRNRSILEAAEVV